MLLPTEEELEAFIAQVPVASRDAGLVAIHLWGSQRRVLREVLRGLQAGHHQMLITKGGRQVGVSVLFQLLTIYWMFRYPGLQGACVTDSDENRDYFRDTLTQMALAAPGAPVLRVRNNVQLAWENASRLLYQTAGPRSSFRLGVGRGLAYLHGTEAPLWVTGANITYLRSAFSDKHPAALYTFEGTPRGRNPWFDVWTEAEDMPGIVRIFVGWWDREDYRLEPDSELYRAYWNGRLTPRERRWTKEVARRWGVRLRPEQLAWRRWYVAEKAAKDDQAADSEMASLPEDGFEATGRSFLSHEAVRHVRRTVAAAPPPRWFRYEWGPVIEATQVRRTIMTYASLTVWETPQPVEGYIVAAVPAFSANATCPTSVASVWRATRDTLVQVAEFADRDCGMQPFAWVLADLVWTYQAARRALILETLGFGNGVLEELRRLFASGWGTHDAGRLRSELGGVRHYLWRRPDSLAGGTALQWRSSPETRGWVLNRLRDQLVSKSVEIRSGACLRELERVRQEGDLFVPEGREAEDHRVVAAALAVESWSKQLRPLFQRVQGTSSATTVMGRLTEGFFDRLRQPAATGARR